MKGEFSLSDIVKWQYQEKLITPDQAAKLVKSGDHVFYSEFAMFPEVLDEALSKRVDELQDVRIRSVSYTKIPKVVQVDPSRQHFWLEDWHMTKAGRSLHDQDLCNYIPITYHQGPRITKKYEKVDVAFVQVAKPDARGFFNLGPSNSVTPAYMSKAKTIVVEVNENVPHCLGGNGESIHISQVDHVVEGNHSPLIQIPEAVPTETDYKIADFIMQEIEDGCTIQLGIGGLPNVIGAKIADSDLLDLGIHTEMLVDSCVDMYNAGRITGARKNVDTYKMTYTFAMGTDKLYKFLDHNPICASYGVNYTNDPRIIALNDKVIAINSAIEVQSFNIL
jgi:acyl-CoA hydrolase